MRLAILADIHGNFAALEAVLLDAEQMDVEGFIVAGDFTCGVRSQETVDLLRTLEAWVIRGNSEGYLLSFDRNEVPEEWWQGEQWGFTRWTYQHLDREAMDYIAGLPEQLVVALPGTAPIRVVHGSPSNQIEHLYPDRDLAKMEVFRQAGLPFPGQKPTPLDPVLDQLEEDVLVCGHSHIAWQQAYDGRLALNPGSVGAPIDGDPRAQYALLTWTPDVRAGGRWQATFRAVDYAVGRVRAAFVHTGLLDQGGAFARACLLGIETGLNVPGALVDHARELAFQAGARDIRVMPDLLWQQAGETFAWERYERNSEQIPLHS